MVLISVLTLAFHTVHGIMVAIILIIAGVIMIHGTVRITMVHTTEDTAWDIMTGIMVTVTVLTIIQG